MRAWSIRRCGAWITGLAVCLSGAIAQAQLAPIASAPPAASGPRRLFLEVLINGVSTHMVEPFLWEPPRRFSAARGDLEDLGVKVPGHGGSKDMLALAAIRGVGVRYDEAAQRIELILGDAQRIPRVYDARGALARPPPARADWGALANYALYATSTGEPTAFPAFSGVNASLETRLLSPYGTISQTGLLGNTVGSTGAAMRLDSTLVYAAPDAMTVARAGDTIAGGLAWTRPFRYGGAQVQRDFSLRPDLVTAPVPSVTGSAAVPSTVDVYLDNVKAFSQPVGPGPYQITNLPIVSSSGAARVVVTDASGHEVQSSLPLFASPDLMALGLTDFSLDAGFARRFYATESDAYDPRPLASATLRRGFSDEVTLEAHAEGGAGLANGGVGLLRSFGPWGTLSGAAAGSVGAGAPGGQAYAAYSVEMAGVRIDVSSQRTIGTYQDLAAVTAPRAGGPSSTAAASALGVVAGYASGLAGFDPRPPKALDRISVGRTLGFDPSYVDLSLINLVEADRTSSRILAASISRPLPWNASAYGTVFVDFARQRSAGLSIGLSVPLGTDISVSANASGGGGLASSVEAQKTVQAVDGSTGWRVQDVEGVTQYRLAEAAYRSSYGTLTAGAQQQGGRFGGSAELDGSVAALGGGVFAGNRVEDGFAVVDAGMAGVPVFEDNRPVGVTNPWGKLLVPGLQSYQTNRLGIDPSPLPLTAEAATTQVAVSPARGSGLYVDFGVKLDVRAATIVLVDADRKPLAPGSKGRLLGADQSFVVGYDGQAYVRGLGATNEVVVDRGDSECRASFAFTAVSGRPQTLGPVTCR